MTNYIKYLPEDVRRERGVWRSSEHKVLGTHSKESQDRHTCSTMGKLKRERMINYYDLYIWYNQSRIYEYCKFRHDTSQQTDAKNIF